MLLDSKADPYHELRRKPAVRVGDRVYRWVVSRSVTCKTVNRGVNWSDGRNKSHSYREQGVSLLAACWLIAGSHWIWLAERRDVDVSYEELHPGECRCHDRGWASHPRRAHCHCNVEQEAPSRAKCV